MRVATIAYAYLVFPSLLICGLGDLIATLKIPASPTLLTVVWLATFAASVLLLGLTVFALRREQAGQISQIEKKVVRGDTVMANASPPSPVPLWRGSWLRVITLLLIVEKVVQHLAVTAAFIGNIGDIRASVALDYRLLMVVGAMSAALFALDGWALLRRKSWANTLLIALALIDIAGEFAAQGRPTIVITVSFVVAVSLLILAFVSVREARRAGSY